MIQFRNDWAPRILTEPGMHFNYSSLQFAFKQLTDIDTRDNYVLRISVIWFQVIGFILRRSSGLERCILSHGLHFFVNKKENFKRTWDVRGTNNAVSFTSTLSDDVLIDCGLNFSCGLIDPQMVPWVSSLVIGPCNFGWHARDLLYTFCQTKKEALQNLQHNQVKLKALDM